MLTEMTRWFIDAIPWAVAASDCTSRNEGLCAVREGFQDASIAPSPRPTTEPGRPKTSVSVANVEVGDPGLEPGTSSLSEKRSNRLS